MRIGMVTACYDPVINGVTRMVSLYQQALENMGYEVTIFTLGTPQAGEMNVVRSPGILLGDAGYYFSLRYRPLAQKLLGEMDILHCHHLFMSVEMAHRYGSCPIVYTNHTRYDLYMNAYTPFSQPIANSVMRRIWPAFAGFADVVIAPSKSIHDVMLNFGVQTPLRVIANGIDLRPFSHPKRPFSKHDLNIPAEALLVAYTGRLASEKNLPVLLKQFAQAKQTAPQLHLILIGKGKMLPSLKEEAASLGISDSVHFLGAIPYDQVGNYLAAADIFATASVSEVHPLTVIEAMAAGLPIIATESPGIAETVQSGKTGLLVGDSIDALSTALITIAQDAPLRQQMGQAAQAASRQFAIEQTAAQTVALYEELRQTRPDLERAKPHGRWQFFGQRKKR